MLQTEAINALLVLFLLTETVCLAGVLGDFLQWLYQKRRAARLAGQRGRRHPAGGAAAQEEGKGRGLTVPIRARI